jgi:hypothetical protein
VSRCAAARRQRHRLRCRPQAARACPPSRLH